MLAYLKEHPGLYDDLEALGRTLDEGMHDLIQRGGYPVSWSRVGAMAGLAFAADGVRDWESAAAADTDRFGRFFRGMLEEGIYLAPSAFEALFLCTAHTQDDMERLVAATARVLDRVFAEVSA